MGSDSSASAGANRALMAQIGRLLIQCPDRPGPVAAVSRFLFEQGANLVHSDQHSTDWRGGEFFLRVEFALDGLDPDLLSQRFQPIADEFAMDYRFVDAAVPKRVAIFVSKESHCLEELLWEVRAGDLFCDVVLIASNHPDLEPIAQAHGIPFRWHPADGDKAALEARQQEWAAGADVIVLARYMQILSGSFVQAWPNRILNIHHSFLPAFVGAKPYHQAHKRGVKIIGATAHYVTEELDAGPIIEQDVARVDHRATASDLVKIGRRIERAVLARAVRWHVEDRVLVHGNRTVVFA